jgi:hypothetical protein
MIPALKAIAGAIVLFFGRKLYWFTIAAVGFFATLELTTRLLKEQPPWLAILVALIVASIGAALAVTIQRLAIGLAGFFLGGFLLLQVPPLFDVQLNGWNWLVFILGGLLGMGLVSALFEWMLIILSSLIGSTLISQSSLIPDSKRLLVFLLALVVGLSVQTFMRMKEKRSGVA